REARLGNGRHVRHGGIALRAHTASARSFPLCTCGTTEGTLVNATCTCPLMTSVIAAAIPLYGIWSISMLASVFSISARRWLIEPFPEEAYVIDPGFAFASATSACRSLAPVFGPATSRNGV